MVSAYKSANPPEGMLPEGRPYEIYTRSGFRHFGERGNELGSGELNIGQAFPDRRDQVGILIAEDDKVMIQFLAKRHKYPEPVWTGAIKQIHPSLGSRCSYI